jgi:putative phosphoribosyl transferase
MFLELEQMLFQDRVEAGIKLASQLRQYANRKDVIVLGIPRGGVPVAFEVAKALNAPLDVFVSRKLGVPGQEELAFGAIASGGVRVLDREIVEGAGISDRQIELITEKARNELERREKLYRGDRPSLKLERQTVILVDDGIATGSSVRAAIQALKQLNPAKIVIGVPVAPLTTCNRLKREVDELVCVNTPKYFYAIGQFYADFSQVSDHEVTELLQKASQPAAQPNGRGKPERSGKERHHDPRPEVRIESRST